MEEENKKEVIEQQSDPQPKPGGSDDDLIAALNEMKKNTVAKEEFEKVKAQNKELIDNILHGNPLPVPTEKEPVNIDELRKDLLSSECELSNLEFAKKSLKLREALIEKGEHDPFLPQGQNIVADEDDVKAANRVAAVLQECIDYCDNDPVAFTSELNRRMVDATPKVHRR